MTEQEKAQFIIRTQVDRFTDMNLAIASLAHRTNLSNILMGDDEKFWVADYPICAKLHKMGYEYAVY